MATTTLTLYKHTKLDDMKNFVVDDLAAYLSTKTSETITGFQYQRFEINKTIKLDKSQSYLLKGQSLNRYDYLKISIGELNYYYFILRASWKAEETIELDIKMDTLNTFGFSDVASDSTYTLSNKTLVTREHKDRFGDSLIYNDSPLMKKQMPIPPYTEYYVDDPIANKNYAPTISEIISNRELEEAVSFSLGLGTGANETKYIAKIYNSSGTLAHVIEGHNNITINPYDDEVDFQFTHLDDTQEAFEIFPNMYLIITFTKLSRNSTAIEHIRDMFDYCYMRGNASLYRDRIIDYYQEGLNTILFKKSEKTLLDEDDGNQWYVMFASDNAIASDVSVSNLKYVNPVQVRFYCDKGYSISNSSSHEVILYAYSPLIPKWSNEEEFISYRQPTASPLGEKYFKIGGVTYDFNEYDTIVAIRKNNNDVVFSEVRIARRGEEFLPYLYNVPSIIFYGINTLRVDGGITFNNTEINIGSGEGAYSGTCNPWNAIDLTDPRLIKCIAFPYAPCEFLVGVTSFRAVPDGVVFNTDNVLELNIQQSELFNYTKSFEGVSPQQNVLMDVEDMVIGSKIAKNIKYESKLFHSDYYQAKFVYDSFSFLFQLENIDIDKYIENSTNFKNLEVNYVCSRNVQSKFMFGFPQYTLKMSIQDYDNVLTIERNNEKALFNNAYINYIRSGGYAYDQKKANSQNAVNGITSALSIVGATASTIGGAVSGNGILAVAGVTLAVSSIAQVIRSVHTAQEQDRAISQKLLQSYMQGSSVQGSEDIDILTAFSGNKAKLCYYELSDRMKQAMWDLFYYCGYATHEQKIPNVTTRLYFNFVQADIVFDEFTFNEDIADDIRNKWKEGVTFFHKVDNEWDIEQEYENFEVSLI